MEHKPVKFFTARPEEIRDPLDPLRDEKPIGWLFYRLFTTVGEGMLNTIWKDDEKMQSNFAQNTMNP